MNTVTGNFNTTVRQIAKMLQWPKCHSKKWQRCLSAKKQHEQPTTIVQKLTNYKYLRQKHKAKV